MTPETPVPEDDSNSATDDLALKQPVVRRRKYRLARLATKELRETLRDRRTLVTLILMPLLVYPILSLVFKTFLLSNAGLLGSGDPVVLQIAFAGDVGDEEVNAVLDQIARGVDAIEKREKVTSQSSKDGAADLESSSSSNVDSGSPPMQQSSSATVRDSHSDPFVPFANHKWFYLSPDESLSVEQVVESGQADVGVILNVADRERWQVGRVRLVSRKDAISQAAADYIYRKFEKLNEFDIEQRLLRFKLPTGPALTVTEEVVGPEESGDARPVPLASLVPLILVLMTITGAVYPAIDLTAGERERGTLETLMAAPVPRVGILFSKFVAVLTVAVLTAVLNLIGMFATVWVFQLDKQFGGGVFTIPVMFQIFLLLILFAAFFSALLLAVTSFAKSFKEAQVYLIPIILLSLGPGLMAMAPGMNLDGINSVIPMVNILLLARDVIQSQVMLVPAIIAVATTLLYTYLAIRLAAYIFGSDSILYAAGGSFGDMFQRPLGQNQIVPIMASLFCLVMLFPINFASIGYLGRMPGDTQSQLIVRFLTMGVFTFLAFMVLPYVVAKHQNTRIQSGFGLNSPRWIFVMGGVLLGLSLWPLVMYLTTVWHDVYGVVFGSEKQAQWAQRLVETTAAQVARIRQLPPWVIAISLSVVPAICEEWFFRGMLLRSLLKSSKPLKAILVSAAVFGSFHVLSSSVIAIDRFIPTALIGVILGYLAYKSNSIFPGILLHAISNAIVVFLAYYQPTLTQRFDWFPAEQDGVPITWVLVGGVVAAIGMLLVFFPQRTEDVDDGTHEFDSVSEPMVETG